MPKLGSLFPTARSTAKREALLQSGAWLALTGIYPAGCLAQCGLQGLASDLAFKCVGRLNLPACACALPAFSKGFDQVNLSTC